MSFAASFAVVAVTVALCCYGFDFFAVSTCDFSDNTFIVAREGCNMVQFTYAKEC